MLEERDEAGTGEAMTQESVSGTPNSHFPRPIVRLWTLHSSRTTVGRSSVEPYVCWLKVP